jgi:hypothetical protein
MSTTATPSHPIRYCTGGCSSGPHSAHLYATDPVDGTMDKTYLCPGNRGEAEEYLDDEGKGTLHGFIKPVRSTADDHPYYNFENFPIFLAQSCCNWEIRTNPQGTHCAALAVVRGCESSHYGSIAYARNQLGMNISAEDRQRFSQIPLKERWRFPGQAT